MPFQQPRASLQKEKTRNWMPFPQLSCLAFLPFHGGQIPFQNANFCVILPNRLSPILENSIIAECHVNMQKMNVIDLFGKTFSHYLSTA
jgi:hypothetical protein